MIYGYPRVSSDEQASKGISLDAQEATINEFATRVLQQPVTMYVEAGVSGTIAFAKRKQGKLLSAALKPGDAIVAVRLDRMFRDALDALAMRKRAQKQGFALYLLDLGTDNAAHGNLILYSVLAAQAQTESEKIGERVAGVRVVQRSRGEYLGGKLPFGYAKVVRGHKLVNDVQVPLYALEPVPEQQQIIRVAQGWKANGVSLRAIKTRLRDDHGVQMSVQGVIGILDRMSDPSVATIQQ